MYRVSYTLNTYYSKCFVKFSVFNPHENSIWFYNYPHLTEKETEKLRLSNFLKVNQSVHGGVGIQTQGGCFPSLQS